MSVKEMAKGITYDDPIKTRCVFSVCGKVVTLTWGGMWLRLVRTPQLCPRAFIDPYHPPSVGHPPVTS